MAVSGFLVDVQKVTDAEMDGWKKQFPDSFARKIDEATGVCLGRLAAELSEEQYIMSKVFCIDVAKCNGCYNCQLACKDEHVGNDWAPYAKPQPEIGQFWCKLQENVGGTIPKVKIHYISQLWQPLRERDLHGRLPRRRHLPPRRRTRHR